MHRLRIALFDRSQSMKFPLFCIAALLAIAVHGVETRNLAQYRVDPLSEEWRWQRMHGLEVGSVAIVKAIPGGGLGILNSSNDFSLYDGHAVLPVELPPEQGEEEINAFYFISTGASVVVFPQAVYLYEGGNWTKVASVGLLRRCLDNIVESESGIVWAGLDGGILRIDPSSGVSDFIATPAAVLSLCEGPELDSIWVALASKGEVLEFPLDADEYIQEANSVYRSGAQDASILRASLLRAEDGRIWFINDNHNLPPRVFEPGPGAWASINLSRIGGDNFNFSILETPDGAIWISSRGTLHILKDDAWKVYHSPEYPIPGARSIMVRGSSGHVRLIEQSGIFVQIDYDQQQGLSFDGLHYEDETDDGSLLFISIEDQAVRWPRGSAVAEFHSPEETGISAPTGLLAHANGDWFLSGSHERQAAVSIYDGEAWQRYLFPEIGLSFGHLALLERPNGDVWLGCAQMQEEFPGYEGGIVVFSPDGSGGYSVSKLQPPSFQFRNWSLQPGPFGTVFTSGNGLYENTAMAGNYIELPEAVRYNWIDQVAVDAQGDVWCVIWSHGVFRYSKGSWTQFGEADGLSNNLTSFILCLDGVDPVAATQDGYFRYDGERWSPFMGNLPGLYRGSGRLTQGKDGSIWVNHTHVDWYYRGQRSEAYTEEKKRSFRTVQYVPDRQAPITRWATPPPELMRNTALNFHWKGADAWSRTPARQLQYSYRLDGGDWSPFTADNRLSLDQLRGGRHAIEVRARDADFNVQEVPLHAEFSVVLPLWRQAWFIASLLVGVVAVIGVVVLFIRQRVRHVLEIEQIKMRFFTHLSHELKTPLTLILGPVERLQNEVTDSRQQHYLSLIKSNSQRLLFLVEQLLDLGKFKLSKLQYKPEEDDFIPFARSCLAVFEEWIRDKKQTVVFESALQTFVFAFPHEVFHKIFDNLVNNAIKYTPEGGRITVRVRLEQDAAGGAVGVIEVEDSGPGVPASEQEAIFEPFYRSAAHDSSIEGSGIGLAFVRELTESIGGSVELTSPANAESKDSPGACFRVSFPVSLPANSVAKDNSGSSAETVDEADAQPANGAGSATSAGVILLVEDNFELREFISEELGELAQIETADGVESGFAKAKELIPDIVVSDVVMQGRSGFNLCRDLKADPHTSHIPVVLLTALRSEKHKREGYQSGADDFITKPISPEILRLKLRNLLATVKLSRQRVRQQFVDDTRISGLSDADQGFLDKVQEIVDSELSDEQFDVNVLASKMGFSRSAFYRKFSSLTDLSPAAFIRTKRLRHAAKLLAEGGRTVSEIAFDVGFSDAGYFSRVFKDEFNCSPSEFARKSD